MPPTILFFAGAFADPSCFDAISKKFQEAGCPTVYAYVPSLDPSDPSSVTASKDAEEARTRYLLPLLDEGKEVVVFVHSYGGVVGGAAAAGLSKSARSAEGKPGGVVGLLYLVGVMTKEGESLLQAVGGAYPPFIKQNYPRQGVAVIDPVMPTLYADADPTLASTLEAAMIPHALSAFETPSSTPAWAEPEFDGRRAFIRTIDDQTNPLFLQDMWLDKSRVRWETVDMKTSHCPFISYPDETARIAVELMKRWT
ncbi:prolyl aminopeptidase-like protein [Lophiostoma macrostomum CBS 122681]|uniref:Prolyl aminopeptidase-like protein n=1 Tax=Lophiostoma macrostomum CBS 122681 TaxID=1314788 RepID=A0A6A6T4W5_9PLEO|nr:prolyl aminopeptidase-like protein [Lophiostoma macrostomum CBS 122681]